jgi:MSHA biogenesis protein MshN
MSLINQVLQDLEKRHASGAELGGLSPHVRPMADVPRRGFPVFTALLGVVSVVAIAGAVYFWNSSRTMTPAIRPPASAAVPAPKPVAPLPRAEVQLDTAVQTVLLAPAARLSQELSFIPAEPARDKGKTGKPAADIVKARRSAPAQDSAPTAPLSVVAEAASAAAKPAAASPAPAAQPMPVPVTEASPPGAIDKQMREVPPAERAEILFRKAVALLREGRVSAAEAGFLDALKEDPNHIAARQALLGLLLDSGRNDEAEVLLRRALELNPRQPRHAMVLARLEVERGELTGAINTLVGALPYVGSDPEYYAFLAALLQRESRHKEAVDYYRVALQVVPGNAVWMMGMGLSLRANDQLAEAREAFQRAAQSRQLNAELQAFVERQLRELSPTN